MIGRSFRRFGGAGSRNNGSMSNRFFAGPLTSGMGRKWDDCNVAEPANADTPVCRAGGTALRPRLCLVQCPALPAVSHDESLGRRPINDPIAPRA
jgi:hypothetical protein